jgi:hypothetical protein
VKYRLKPYDEVTNHHLISRELWEKYEGVDLYGAMLTDKVVFVSIANEYPLCVHLDDLIEIKETENKPMKNNETYQGIRDKVDKSVIRNLCAEVMTELAKEKVDVNRVVVVAEAFGRLLNKIPEDN